MILNKFDDILQSSIIYIDNVNSTNQYAKEYWLNNEYKYKIFITDNQFCGKGTNGRKWLSLPYKNGTFSISIKTNTEISLINNLSIIVANTISDYLNDTFDIETYIKGQNDIYCNSKKLCGILVETLINENKIKHLIIGIGININQENFDETLNGIATSLKNEVGIEFEIEKVINDICLSIIKKKEIRVFIDE